MLAVRGNKIMADMEFIEMIINTLKDKKIKYTRHKINSDFGTVEVLGKDYFVSVSLFDVLHNYQAILFVENIIKGIRIRLFIKMEKDKITMSL
jgi:hypothetical protein